MIRRRAYFLDADYVIKNGECYASLLLKGKRRLTLYFRYDPYFYVDAPPEKKDAISKIVVDKKNGETVSPLRVESVEKTIFGMRKKLLKVYCKKPRDVAVLREMVPYECYEHTIPFSRRFMIDIGLVPFAVISYEREGMVIKKILSVRAGHLPTLSKLAFDIETYNPLGAPREKTDPIIMISYANRENRVLSLKKSSNEFVDVVDSERALIERFCSVVKQHDPDMLIGYNSSAFDIPYLQNRALVTGAQLNLGRGRSGMIRKIKKGLVTGVKIRGRIHFDAYPGIRFFGFAGLLRSQNFTLESVYKEMTGKEKKMIVRRAIWKMWDRGEVDELADYAMADAIAVNELTDIILPLQMELSMLSKMPLFDATLATSGQLVESILMWNATKNGVIIPPKPHDRVVLERQRNPIKGAFVKLPEPGIYENIAVLDFRGMYPSIIVSYNIDPFTILKDGDCFISPTGTRFSKKVRGLIPTVLEELLSVRAKIKDELKRTPKNSATYRWLLARSNAIKILVNSFYGFLGYARSRWYSRECAESVTAWGRAHIQNVINEAEKDGFKVLYADTDSTFLLMENKDRNDVLKFLEKVNEGLPKEMELELEGFYRRGVFVSKKAEKKGAKKKYALLGDDERIKIRGFELVRRDWSKIAKATQYAVLETILKEGSKEKAVRIVRDAIEHVRSGNASIDELSIETQLRKEPGRYEVKSPELAAAAKGKERGIPFERGSVISYVITKNGKTISEKAQLAEFAEDYDADYYINNQIVPAVMKILGELGYDEHELKSGGKQKKLDGFL